MKKIFFSLLCCAAFSAGHAQTNKQVQEAATAPDRARQSARADLYVHDKTAVSETKEKNAATAKATKPRKKKGCGHSCCKKS